MVTTESHYQYGPDTYLLQHRDVDFPVRLRQYMKASQCFRSVRVLFLNEANMVSAIKLLQTGNVVVIFNNFLI